MIALLVVIMHMVMSSRACKRCVLKLEQSNGYKEIEQPLRARAKSTRTLVANSSVLDMSTTMVCA